MPTVQDCEDAGKLCEESITFASNADAGASPLSLGTEVGLVSITQAAH
jgi:hypothetical protein